MTMSTAPALLEKTGERAERRRFCRLPSLSAASASTALTGIFVASPVLAEEVLSGLRLSSQMATTASALLVGLVTFAATSGIMYVRERSRWQQRERDMQAELEALLSHQARLAAALAGERQIVFSWPPQGGEPVVEGDSGLVVAAGSPASPLAFGAWAVPEAAQKLEKALDSLKRSGEPFRLEAEMRDGRFAEASGRPVAGRAVLRLREISGERAELLASTAKIGQVSRERDRLLALLDGLPQPAWQRDVAGRLIWANPAYVRAVDAPSCEEVTLRQIELMDSDERRQADQSRQQGLVFNLRAPVVVSGTRRMVDLVEVPTVGGTSGLAIDMSELEAVRSDLGRQMEAHVRTLDKLPSAVAVFDARQRLVYRNAAFEKLWALDAAFLDASPSDGEILDRLRTERRLPELGDYRTWKGQLLSAYASVAPVEDWWHLPDGRMLYRLASPNPQGGLTCLFDDVSERVTLESRVNAMSRVQRETLDSLREGVAVFGPDGRLKLSNPAFAKSWNLAFELLSASPHVEEVVRHCQPLFGDAAIWSDVSSAVTGVRDAREDVLCRMQRTDGMVLDCAAVPLPDGATLLTFVDVSASVNVERALTERNEALEKASQLREDFVHHVSYELRSPLTSIIGFAELISEEMTGPLNPRQREYTSHILRSSGALLAIINDILDLASIDTGEMVLEPAPLDVGDVVAEAARGLADRLAETGIALVTDIPADIGPLIADGRRLRQVLFNLLSNAIGFSSKGQDIRIIARREESHIRITVSDRGRGIPAEVMEKVFKRFESHALGSRHRGAGLGLSIVRSIIELHGGSVDLRSAPGQGTDVTLHLPTEGQRLQAAAQ